MDLSGEEAWLIETIRSKGEEGLGPYVRLVIGVLYATCIGLWLGDRALLRSRGWSRVAPDANRILEMLQMQTDGVLPEASGSEDSLSSSPERHDLPADQQLLLFMQHLLQRERDRMLRIGQGSIEPEYSKSRD